MSDELVMIEFVLSPGLLSLLHPDLDHRLLGLWAIAPHPRNRSSAMTPGDRPCLWLELRFLKSHDLARDRSFLAAGAVKSLNFWAFESQC